MSDPGILDLERLREIYEDDREGIVELLNLAVETAQAQLVAIAAAFESRDAAALRGAAHAIKGASVNVGAAESGRLAAELEADAIAQRWETIPNGITALRGAVTRLEEQVAAFAREG